MKKSSVYPKIFLFFILLSIIPYDANGTETKSIQVPGPWSSKELTSGFKTYQCWIKVPAHWTNTSGRNLWTESVTFTIEKLASSHELWINGKKIGSAGNLTEKNFQSGFLHEKIFLKNFSF